MIRSRADYFLSAPDVLEQIRKADLDGYLAEFETTETSIHGFVPTPSLPALLAQLRKDNRFAEGLFYGLHRDVGQALTDFRSFRGVLGEGSLQIVIDKETGRFYADVDKWNPYADVVNFLGHTGEVVAGFFGGWGKKDKRA